MLIRLLPLLAGVLPFVATNAAFLIGVHYGPLPSCIPYVDGCTSISATGRYAPASYLFRGVMMPMSVLLVLVWYYTTQWLRQLDATKEFAGRGILLWGILGALALVIYVTFLGTREPIYEFMRRFGIYLYFLGSVLAQLLATLQLRKTRLAGYAKTMFWLLLAPFALGILNLVFKSLMENADAMENRIEWTAAVFMQAWYVVLYLAWRRSGFTARVSVDPPSAGRSVPSDR